MDLLNDPTLRDLFEQEAAEELDGIERLLPRLGEPAAADELFRHAHTLKGSAAVMGVGPVSTLAAALELIFDTLRRRGTAPEDGVVASIRAAVGDLRFLVSGLLTGLDVGNVAEDAEQSLRALEQALGGDAQAAGESRAAEESVVEAACAGCRQLEPLVRAVAAAQARTLRLLAAQAGVDAASLPELRALEPAPDDPRRRGSVLVVDDSRTVRELHRGLLAGVGYEVRTAADGGEAVRLLADRPADVVVTDLDMPGMDGLRLTEWIRARALPSPAVVVITSHGDERSRRRLIDAGADVFLAKDRVDGEQLVAQVDALVAAAR